ncbi:MAG: hypothetical protein ACD_75C01332G0001 [uncultured bacterium]|nr:MAG: hypothetical protein ACD_75C01332G0001 [uncultured bacterium]
MGDVVQKLSHRRQTCIVKQNTVLLQVLFHLLGNSLLKVRVQRFQLPLFDSQRLFGQRPLHDFLLQFVIYPGKCQGPFCDPLLKRFIGVPQLHCQGTDMKMHPYTGQDFFPLQRFGDVIHSPRCESLYLVIHFRQGGHENNGNIAGSLHAFQAPAGLKTVNPGHEHIQQHQVGHGQERPSDAAFAILRNEDFVAVLFQNGRHDGEIVGIVVDNQDKGLMPPRSC